MTGLDLTEAIEAARKAIDDRPHEDWCCAKQGCVEGLGHFKLGPPIDDGSGSMFMTPQIIRTGQCGGTEDNCECGRRQDLEAAKRAVEAAAPLILAAAAGLGRGERV